jgi:hypothetical protein
MGLYMTNIRRIHTKFFTFPLQKPYHLQKYTNDKKDAEIFHKNVSEIGPTNI